MPRRAPTSTTKKPLSIAEAQKLATQLRYPNGPERVSRNTVVDAIDRGELRVIQRGTYGVPYQIDRGDIEIWINNWIASDADRERAAENDAVDAAHSLGLSSGRGVRYGGGEKSLLTRLQAERIHVELSQQRGELMRVEEVEEFLGALAAQIKEFLGGIPDRFEQVHGLTPDHVQSVQDEADRLQAALHQRLDRWLNERRGRRSRANGATH